MRKLKKFKQKNIKRIHIPNMLKMLKIQNTKNVREKTTNKTCNTKVEKTSGLSFIFNNPNTTTTQT